MVVLKLGAPGALQAGVNERFPQPAISPCTTKTSPREGRVRGVQLRVNRPRALGLRITL